MSASGIAAFFDRFVDGVDTRRRWDQEEKDRALAAEDRKLALEDRERRNKFMDEDRAIRAEDRQFERGILIEDRDAAKEDRARRNSREDILWQRSEAEIGRKEKARERIAESHDTAKAGYADQQAKAALAEGEIRRGTRQIGGLGDVDEARRRGSESFYDYWTRTEVPKLRDAMIASGDVDGANAYQAWIEQTGVQRGIRSYGRALQAAAVGDEGAFLDNMAEVYNNNDYYGDGMSVDRSKSGFKKDKAGNIVGGSIAFKNERTGKTFVQDIGSEADLYRLGLTALSPEAAFDYGRQAMAAQQAGASEIAKEDRKHANDIDLEREKAMLKAITEKTGDEKMQTRLADTIKVLMEANPALATQDPKVIADKAMQMLQAQQAAISGGSLGTVALPGMPQVPVWRGE